ncbi:Coatomer beta subunit [Trema orientale]|uniref:Coatomer beta subunit n=1 Tax=Trema orientale TaxID=63057 RepID=A0A2P5EYJ7_TREOI|nr:Coatomer beta subunit [Trema orientale]
MNPNNPRDMIGSSSGLDKDNDDDDHHDDLAHNHGLDGDLPEDLLEDHRAKLNAAIGRLTKLQVRSIKNNLDHLETPWPVFAKSSTTLQSSGVNNLDHCRHRHHLLILHKYQNDRYYQWLAASLGRTGRDMDYRAILHTFGQVRGQVCSVAREIYGCNFLKFRLQNGNPEEKHMIFSEAKEDLCSLMVHRVGNILVKHLIQVVKEDKLLEILIVLTRDVRRLRSVCSDDNGTVVMMGLVMRLRTQEQQSLLISAMTCIALTMTKSKNGNLVINCCLKHFHAHIVEPILGVIATKCLEIATDKYGYCILQNCILKAKDCIPFKVEVFNTLVANIIQNAHFLSEHCCGNYAVQCLIELKMPQINQGITTQLEGRFVSLSMKKQGSNVVEKLLIMSGEEIANRITNEILSSSRSLEVLQDSYGNSVARFALEASRGSVRNALDQLIVRYSPQLENHSYGKRLLHEISLSKKHKRSPA